VTAKTTMTAMTTSATTARDCVRRTTTLPAPDDVARREAVGDFRRLLVFLLLLAACGSSRTAGVVASPRFPSREALERIVAAPLGESNTLAPVDVDRWELNGPFPDEIGLRPTEDTSPWTTLVREVAGTANGLAVVSDDMQCVAREIGRFELEHAAPPARDLQDFIMERCGSTGVRLALRSLNVEAPDDVSDAQLIRRYRAQLVDELRNALSAGPMLAGIWVGRHGRQATLQLALAERQVRLDGPAPRVDARGNIVLQGELLAPVAQLEVVANRGRFGVATCPLDASVQLPRFVATCPVDHARSATRIEIFAVPQGRILGQTALSLLVPSADSTGATFARATPISSRAVSNAEDAGRHLVELINAIREQAGLEALELDAGQLRTTCRAAPYYTAAAWGQLPANVADTLALGLMAGWDVDGLVREGWFASTLGGSSRDLGAWLAMSLERPTLRRMLLERRAARIAPCAVLGPDGGIRGVLWTAYSLFQPENLRSDLSAYLQRVVRSRAAEGLPTPLYDRDLTAPIDHGLEGLRPGVKDLEAVLDEVLTDAVFAAMQDVRGWVIQTRAVECADVPRPLLEEPHLTIAIGGAYWIPRDDAWARLVILVVTTHGRSNRQIVE
jgi:hypothetical protein